MNNLSLNQSGVLMADARLPRTAVRLLGTATLSRRVRENPARVPRTGPRPVAPVDIDGRLLQKLARPGSMGFDARSCHSVRAIAGFTAPSPVTKICTVSPGDSPVAGSATRAVVGVQHDSIARTTEVHRINPRRGGRQRESHRDWMSRCRSLPLTLAVVPVTA